MRIDYVHQGTVNPLLPLRNKMQDLFRVHYHHLGPLYPGDRKQRDNAISYDLAVPRYPIRVTTHITAMLAGTRFARHRSYYMPQTCH